MIPILPNNPVRNVNIARIKNNAFLSDNVYLKEYPSSFIVCPIDFLSDSFAPIISFVDAKHTQKQGMHTIENTSAAIKYPCAEDAHPLPNFKIIAIVTTLITIWINPDPTPLNAFKDTRSSFEVVITFATHCVEILTAV